MAGRHEYFRNDVADRARLGRARRHSSGDESDRSAPVTLTDLPCYPRDFDLSSADIRSAKLRPARNYVALSPIGRIFVKHSRVFPSPSAIYP